MSDIDDFKSYLESHQAAFAAWGRFVAEEIQNQLSNVISPVPVANFLKIEAKPRVKEISSALAKIGRKNYTSPQTQMTDLVGVRFVVLLAEREVAKSMALMETTDDLFSRTLAILKEANQPQEELLPQLSQLYQEEIGLVPEVDKKTNMIFLETFQSSIDPSNILANIRSLLNEKKYLANRIKENAEEMYFFSQPAALLVYWLIEKVGADEVWKKWPLPAYNKNLKFICTDLDKQPSHELF